MDQPTPNPLSRPTSHMSYRSRHRAQSHDTAHADVPPPVPFDLPDDALIPRSAAKLIVADDELMPLIAHLRQAGSFAYDTEFIGEMTYHPQLCLIQVATPGQISLIDPLSDINLQPFWELLNDASIEKIMHAGPQDVEPIHRLTGDRARNVFDTQIAAGFCALAYPVALGKLVGEMLSYKMSKGLTFTDWQRRPLSASQLRYAADDVRFLPALAARLKARLAAVGRAKWVTRECDAMCNPDRYAFDGESDFYHIRGAGTLSLPQLSVLRSLMIWRNDIAKESSMPPRALMRDETLIDLSRHPPRTMDKLERTKFLGKPVIDRHGQTIIRTTADAFANPPADLRVSKPHEPLPSERFRIEALWAAMQVLCLSQGIDPAAVASRQEVAEFDRAFAAGESLDHLNLMTDWRREAVGETLLKLLTDGGEVGLRWPIAPAEV